MAIKKDYGLDNNYFKRITVGNPNFNTLSDIEFPLRGPVSFILINEGTGTIEYSFNGNTVHGDMVANSSSSSIVRNSTDIRNIWFKLKSGSSSAVRVEASSSCTFSSGGSGSSGGGSGGGDSTIISPLGSNTSSQSISVTLANDQSAILISGSVTSNIGTTNGLALDTTLTTLSSKIPSAASLADGTANPSVSGIASYGELFNGTTWDRVKGGLIGAQSSAIGIQNTLSMGRYNSSAPTLTNGQLINLQLDVSGNLKIVEQNRPTAEDNTNSIIAFQTKPVVSAVYSPTAYSNLSSSPSAVVKNSPGMLLSFFCQNFNANRRFIQFFNTTSALAGGEIPVLSFPIVATSSINIGNNFLTSAGVYFSTGITFGFSATATTYTAGVGSDQLTVILYK